MAGKRNFAWVTLCVFFAQGIFCRQHEELPNLDDSSISLDAAFEKKNIIPLAIIGGGPAGLTASLYGGRAKIHTVVFTGEEPGGQLVGTTDVQNWPAIKKMWGYEIMDLLTEQATHFGAEILQDTVTEIDCSQWPYRLRTENGLEAYALTVIIATGAKAKRLHILGEDTYWGNGVSKCALCDAPCYEKKSVVVIGGGDSAVEEALQLAPYAERVTVIVRSDRMRAAPTMQDRLAGFSNIKVEYNLQVTQILGDGEKVSGIVLVDSETGEEFEQSIDGVFIAIGHEPNTQLFDGQLHMDGRGYIVIAPFNQETSSVGIFAAGEVHDDRYRQACIACGYGAAAALDAIEFLRDHNFNEKIERRLQSRYFRVK